MSSGRRAARPRRAAPCVASARAPRCLPEMCKVARKLAARARACEPATMTAPEEVSVAGAAGAAAVSVDVSPRVTVAMEGQRVTVQCRAGRALQYCRIEHTTPRAGQERSTWNLNEDLPQSSDGVKYAGAGLESGQCGFTVQRLPASFNGGFRCTMGFRNLPEEGIGVFNITVAVAPNAPDLAVSSSGQRPSYGSGYGSNDRYPSRDESEFRDGDTLTASCTIRDSRPPANISWFLDDQEVTRGLTNLETIHTTDRDLFTVKQNLSYQLSWRDHGKMLRCVAGHLALEDSNRNNQTSAAVNVKFAPRPHSNPIDQFGFIVGVPGEIAVEVNAYPKPTVSWKINEEVVQENSAGYDGHFHASSLMNNGSGSWTAVLRINEVNMEDIEREYALSARNELGEETYRIRLSTSSEPIVTSLEAGAIIGIVVAILVLLLAIFLLVFARTTGRWCFAASGGRGKTSHSSSEAHIDPEKTATPPAKGEGEGGMENPSANHNVSSEYINGNQQEIKKAVKDDKDTPV
ncbi:Fasciclin-3 [Gryllus bimaculatus]|nr:Fasciclin-3 [Gryllus bimaculatus]